LIIKIAKPQFQERGGYTLYNFLRIRKRHTLPSVYNTFQSQSEQREKLSVLLEYDAPNDVP